MTAASSGATFLLGHMDFRRSDKLGVMFHPGVK